MKKLYKTDEGKVIAGVCMGLSEYFKVDVSLIRIGFIIAAFTTIGIIGYIAAAIVLPDKSEITE